MDKYSANCNFVLLPDPSAILEGIEQEHLFIWSIRLYLSSLGNSLQYKKIRSVKSIDFCRSIIA